MQAHNVTETYFCSAPSIGTCRTKTSLQSYVISEAENLQAGRQFVMHDLRRLL